jgi:hypothetical protein
MNLISTFAYIYGRNGNVKQKTELQKGTTELTTYGYNFVNMVERIEYPEKIATYDYDLAGNRISEVEIEKPGSNAET